ACLQVSSTFTWPAPDWPSTSMWASSSWAFFRLSCIAWACFISPANWFFIMVLLLEISTGFDRAGHDARGLVLRHQGLHQRVVVDDLLGLQLTARALGRVALRGRVFGAARLDLEAHRALQRLGQGGLEFLA